MVKSDIRDQLNRALSVTGGVSSDFDLNPDVVLPEGRKLRPAAVLVGVTMDGSVLLTKRSSRLKHHPGQIAFPGGKQDEGDANLAATALREAQEEVGLPTEIVDIIGTLPTHETVTSFTVTPIVGLIRERFDPLPEAGEVEEVFTVPLTHVTNPARFQVEYRRWQGRRRRYYTVPYGPYYIWGATARILRGLAERMQA
ncbi:CoA pyrophosphatase [Actibacterium pelagium]|uniref:CoA pyrophosphatase n=1 Tax=Actibacterium pelagium TaxID=2029103 RepID=UPI00166BAAF6|nr:CoA pyrophosphatase [Actibacterium pelagium]